VHSLNPNRVLWRQTLKIAVGFWATWLALGAVEAKVGSNAVVASVFFLSIPALVFFLTWANKDILHIIPRRSLSVLVLGVSVLLSSSVIVLVGLIAAAKLKLLISGA
jgi:hypothetical protein